MSNIFKTFRDPITGDAGRLRKSFDEPTYLSFRLLFYPKNNDMTATNYDKVPHPLFLVRKEDDINARNYYSTYQYLRDIKEPQRARMLEQFIEDWNSLQTKNQWYFQSIDGLNNMLSFDPGRGIRVSQEDGYLTVNMLEAIDQRIFNLLTLYRKIAWDDVYQRWILPDWMRYFAMDIYVTEFRTFHEPLSPNPEEADRNDFRQGREPETFLRVLENTLPTYLIKCEMCEFDLPSLNFENMNNINIAENPDPFTSAFRIKVGKVYEEYINPVFNLFWSDNVINHFRRTVDYGALNQNVENEDGIIPDPLSLDSDRNRVRQNEALIAQNQSQAKKKHYSGRPWYENQDHLENSSPEAGLRDNVDPTEPNTWIDNAATFGKAFVNNFVEDSIEKAKMTEISVFGRNLGVSYNQISSAFESRNFVSLYGLVRRAIDQNIQGTVATTIDQPISDNYPADQSPQPSSEIESDLADRTFRGFLEGIINSEATADDSIDDMKRAANIILNDQGKWEQIKDYSLATDLTSSALDERDTKNELESGYAREQGGGLQQTNDRSLSTDLDGGPKRVQAGKIIEDVPTSQATNNPIKNE